MADEFKYKHRAGTVAQWADPQDGPLLRGEIGVLLDDNGAPLGAKIGDGETAFDALPDLGGNATSGAVMVASYGAVGNGVADDTAALQAAIDAASTAGGGVVQGRKGDTYLLSQAGTKTVSLAAGGTSSQGYALSLPSNVHLDLNGATLTQGASGDFAFVMNASPNATTDTDLGLSNGVIDGNAVQHTTTPLVLLTGCTRPTVKGLRFTAGTYAGLYTYNNDQGAYDGLVADAYAGNPFMLGQPYSGKTERSASIGTVSARTITADAVNAANFPGNSFYGCLSDSSVDSILGVSCAAGVKFQGPGADVAIGRVLVLSVTGGTTNSGVKFQSSAVRHSIGQVLAEDQTGEGLFIEASCTDITVSNYVGKGNGTAGTNPDVWIDGTRPHVEHLRSVNAGQVGVQVRSTAVDYRLGTVVTVNSGQVAGSGTSTSTGASVAGGSGTIGDFAAVDDQGTKTMARGMDINGSAASLRVMSFKATGMSLPIAAIASTDAIILNPKLGTDPGHGEASPAAAATSTTVSNNNIGVDAVTVQPIIEVIPLNATAQALGVVRVSFGTGSMTFHHAAADGTEKLSWRLVGYRRSTTAA